MAWTPILIDLDVDLALGSDIEDTAPVHGATVLRKFPAVYMEGDSFRLRCQVWVNRVAGTKANFGDAATCRLYIKRYGVSDIPTLLSTGSIAESATGFYDTLDVTVAEGATDGYGGQSCLLYLLVTAAGEQRTIIQQLDVTSLDGSGDGNPSGAEMAYTPADETDWPTTVPDDVAEALDVLAERVTDLEGAAENNDIDPDTETIDAIAVDAPCAVTWDACIWQEATGSMRKMLVQASLSKTVDASGTPSYTFEYDEGPGPDDIGTVPAGGLFSVTYDETSHELRLQATVTTENWYAKAKRLAYFEFDDPEEETTA